MKNTLIWSLRIITMPFRLVIFLIVFAVFPIAVVMCFMFLVGDPVRAVDEVYSLLSNANADWKRGIRGIFLGFED